MFKDTSFSNQLSAHGPFVTSFIQEHCTALQAPKKILCLGDTQGNTALFLAQKGIDIEVLEIEELSPLSIHKSIGEHYQPMRVCHSSLLTWEKENIFDIIVCTFLHIPKASQPSLLEKCFQALKNHGVLIAELLSESQKSLEPKAFSSESDYLFNFNQTLKALKETPFRIDKFSQEIIALKDENLIEKRTSVLHIVATKIL